jgi:hypothetical protein
VLHDGRGLYLRVSATGAKSWVFRFQLDGKRRDMGLQPYPPLDGREDQRRAPDPNLLAKTRRLYARTDGAEKVDLAEGKPGYALAARLRHRTSLN